LLSTKLREAVSVFYNIRSSLKKGGEAKEKRGVYKKETQTERI
jgi:hypothetical protein